MGRLICSMMDFELDEFGDILSGRRYQEHDPEEYYWIDKDNEFYDEENSLEHRMEMGYSPIQD